METRTSLLSAVAADPADALGWQALADWLEEHGEARPAELGRLALRLRRERDHPEHPAWAERVQPCVPEVVNSAGMRLALVPPGAFHMGSPADEEERDTDEEPRHEVEI